MTDSMTFRHAVLRSCGASEEVATELLAYTESPFHRMDRPVVLPLGDEPHIEAWTEYADEARAVGAFEALRRRFVQLRFPIEAGISGAEAYRKATRRGSFDEADAFSPGLVLKAPARLELSIHPSIAGKIPVLVSRDRSDFESLVRAFTERNEPVEVPAAMGACIVTGLNNWDRVARYRSAWERALGSEATQDAWAEELRSFASRKELYQDRFVILSTGPYSAVSAAAAGVEEGDWLRHSLIIRREHELTHYFTFRLFGVMRNHLLDELLADFAGLVGAFGVYREELALFFLGLESFPSYRPGGRLECYRGNALSDAAFAVLVCLGYRAVRNLARFADANRELLEDLGGLARAILAFGSVGLETLASDEMLDRLEIALA
jgi:hypothetical protein